MKHNTLDIKTCKLSFCRFFLCGRMCYFPPFISTGLFDISLSLCETVWSPTWPRKQLIRQIMSFRYSFSLFVFFFSFILSLNLSNLHFYYFFTPQSTKRKGKKVVFFGVMSATKLKRLKYKYIGYIITDINVYSLLIR